jgi:hypothetical protein
MRLGIRVLVWVALAGCARPEARAPTWDTPIPMAEKRATVRVLVDLEPLSNCDERFDLAMYEERGVELIAWDPETRGCQGRRATVRFVPGRIAREAVLERIRKLSKTATVLGAE